MTQKIIVDPVTRIEGHLKIEVELDNGRVVDAKASGTLFRGFEMILQGRDPRDAQHLTQRICGVCPISHGISSVLNLDDAFGIKPPTNGRILRNLIHGANFIQSHILHFYHLAALDFVKGPETAPFIPRYDGEGVYRLPKSVNEAAVGHYIQALDIRKKTHMMVSAFGAKAPHCTVLVPGGVTEVVKQDKVDLFAKLLQEVTDFVDNVYIPEVMAIAGAYEDNFAVGRGCGNLLAYGVFPLVDGDDPEGDNQLIKGGCYTDGQFTTFDAAKINEHVMYSWFDSNTSQRHPSEGITKPVAGKRNAYSWIKAPRYGDKPHEVGPLARMWINKEPRTFGLGDKAFSVLGRHFARAVETSLVAHAMKEWLDQLVPGEPTFAPFEIPKECRGMGLTEAPRGALGHFVEVRDYRIANYQCVVPTTWNCSPRDDHGVMGPVEEALMETTVKDPENPVELVRIVRSFDPCLACAVHLLEVKGHKKDIMAFRVS